MYDKLINDCDKYRRITIGLAYSATRRLGRGRPLRAFHTSFVIALNSIKELFLEFVRYFLGVGHMIPNQSNKYNSNQVIGTTIALVR